MTDLPLTQTPDSDRDHADEYVRIQRTADKTGYLIYRSKITARRGRVDEVLGTLCGGNMGRLLAATVAQTAAKTGLIETIYLDKDC